METSIVFVSGANNEPMVSSRVVAEKFGKEHRRVLQGVREQVIPFLSEQFSQHHFVLATYVDEQGKPRQEILMTKDGFMLVAMSFTGPEAIAWKVRFIDAFNQAIGSISELREELTRKEQVILALQADRKKRKSPRLRVPNFNVFEGHEPKWELQSITNLTDPMKTLGLLRKTISQIEGLRKLAESYRQTLGISES
jgi:Rha family phage regulatory protein